eukprot:CAMPEP_0172032032 /NCGR_PEP_ID=MMETSP1041-20130122/19644_1 /TAXON_ID=464988 /ORGANISM="Hemiselmis andersenii, Strain CCMP439" /LENGTH=36 /DNA_ID= /DNA_START= /DNA_END= /DNA_ORIENTATION=
MTSRSPGWMRPLASEGPPESIERTSTFVESLGHRMK